MNLQLLIGAGAQRLVALQESFDGRPFQQLLEQEQLPAPLQSVILYCLAMLTEAQIPTLASFQEPQPAESSSRQSEGGTGGGCVPVC